MPVHAELPFGPSHPFHFGSPELDKKRRSAADLSSLVENIKTDKNRWSDPELELLDRTYGYDPFGKDETEDLCKYWSWSVFGKNGNGTEERVEGDLGFGLDLTGFGNVERKDGCLDDGSVEDIGKLSLCRSASSSGHGSGSIVGSDHDSGTPPLEFDFEPEAQVCV